MYLKAPIAISSSLYVWVKEVVHKLGKLREVYDRHKYEKILVPPKLVSKLYSKIEAYINHYKCDDGPWIRTVSYDCGVASLLSA